MYRFPSNPDRRKVWETNVKRIGWTPTPSSYLCEEHFEYHQFENGRVDGKKKLRSSALPTIFKPKPSAKTRTRKSIKEEKLIENTEDSADLEDTSSTCHRKYVKLKSVDNKNKSFDLKSAPSPKKRNFIRKKILQKPADFKAPSSLEYQNLFCIENEICDSKTIILGNIFEEHSYSSIQKQEFVSNEEAKEKFIKSLDSFFKDLQVKTGAMSVELSVKIITCSQDYKSKGDLKFEEIGETSSVSRFIISAPDVAVRWKKWLRSFEIFLTARGVVNAIQQNALLLNIAGEEIMDLVDTFPDDRLVATETSNVYEVLVKALNEHFRPLVNVPFERSIFRRADCSEEETVDVYATRLRKLAKSCEYGDNLDDIIRDQIIEKVHSQQLRRKFLEQGSSLTLSALLNLSRTYESVEVQNSRMSAAISGSSVSAIRKTGTRDRSTLQSVMCYRCGYKGHRSDDRSCPAWKKTCVKCGETGHFAKAKFCKGVSATFQSSTSGRRVWKNAVSRRDAVREVYSDDEDGILFHVGPAHGPTAVVTLSNKNKSVDIPVIIDSGASANVMDWITYSGIVKENLDVELSVSSKGLFDVSNNRLPLEGEFLVNVSFADSAVSDSKFYVCKNVSYTLLSYETARALSMIKISENVRGVKYDALQDKYRVLFEGMGKLTDCLIELHIDESNMVPKAMSWVEIKTASERCDEITEVRRALHNSDFGNCMNQYRVLKEELSEIDGILLRGDRIVIPKSLRSRVVAIAHEGHQGVVKTKSLLRTKVWWPGMDKEVERFCRHCYECQILGRPEPPVPLVSTKIPENAWEYLATDLMGPLPNGEHVLVLLPTVERHGRLEGCESWKEKDTLNKFKMKEYSDERKGTKVHDVKVGNRVLVKVNKKQNKLTPEFERKPYEVTRVKGGEIECMNESRKIRRNVSQLKKLNERIIESLNEDVQAGDDKSEQLEERSRARESVNNNLEEKELESNVSLTNRSRASESNNTSLEEKDNLEPKASLRKSTRVSKFPSKFKDFVT
ncbi:hypothetical protein GQR58_005524 [Nymphon striatum]|nr:hypothetical protein GQR58_005524 [Nymphon striatum]